MTGTEHGFFSWPSNGAMTRKKEPAPSPKSASRYSKVADRL